jgi:plastocyanin
MRSRISFVAVMLLFATPLFAKDVYLSIGGSVGNFRTDARIFNPSFNKTISVTGRYLPAGNSDNSAVAPVTVTIAPRTMAIYNDVVQSLFGGGPALGGVRLTSDDDFVATQRIYADESANAQNGTLGQFVPGLDVTSAIKKGVLVQLRQNGGRGQKGTFRTNWGAVNPNAVAANVTLKLYDKHNAVVGTSTINIKPFGVLGPAGIGGLSTSASSDLSDSWIGFDSDQPIFVYGSVLDNGSEDPTFIPASADSGVPPLVPEPQQKTVIITARNWSFDVEASAPLKAGDEVKFIVKSAQDRHGFHLSGPNGQNILSVDSFSPGTPIERTVKLPADGTYSYFCTVSTCGVGHFSMNGQFEVGQGSGPGTGDRYE